MIDSLRQYPTSAASGRRRSARRAILGATALAAAALTAAPVAAEENIAIELNRIEDSVGGCLSHMVLNNGSGLAFTDLQLDLVMFDTDGIIIDQLAVNLGPLRADKIMVRVFEIPGVACTDIGVMLLNDVLSCGNGEEEWADCVEMMQPSSRAAVDFIM